jgi:hypothetical protein
VARLAVGLGRDQGGGGRAGVGFGRVGGDQRADGELRRLRERQGDGVGSKPQALR